MNLSRWFIGAAALVALPNIVVAQDIIVKGKSLAASAAALEECLKRDCPPDQDIRATLAHAENLFVSGDYESARGTLRASLGRNRKHGAEFPIQVSDLLRANSRVAEHMGEGRDYQLSTLSVRDVLKKSLGADDFRTLVAEIEVGDSRAKLGFPTEAERIFRTVEKRAIELKHYRIASFARLRLATMARKAFDAEPTGANRTELDKRLNLLIDAPLPDGEEFIMAAKVLKARIDRKRGSSDTTDELVRQFAAKGGADRPLLLFSEPLARIDLGERTQADGDSARPSWTRVSTNRYGQWVDIGFWIGQQGRVTDVEVLRSQGDPAWSKPLLGNISRRIYAPLKSGGESSPGFYMIERYTLTARVVDGETGTRLRTREATPRIERLDLTEDSAEPAATQG